MNRRMTLGTVAGIILAAIVGSGILFVPEEPLKVQILIATTIKGGLIGLMLAAVLSGSERWPRTLLVGALLSGLMGVEISLAKGFDDAPFAVPASVVEGLVLAAILKKWG